mmetsp:Transcript_13230/g.21722  ORF Transcript_13230/g.21722 Transcript_13230/m.21722 type:complete len:1098 (+) Transcript_13230:237-3530(+)
MIQQLGTIALALAIGGCSIATALMHTNGTFDSFEYADPELQQISDWNVAERLSITGEGVYYVDGRSGKPAVIYPAVGDASILPGDGVGNRLLWTVGTSHDEGHGPLTDHRMLSGVAVDACKQWITNHQDELGINVEELFAPGMVRTATHPDGDIQLSLTRTFKGIEVVGSRVAINIVAGNIATVAVEQWGDISMDFGVTPTITAEDALNVLSTHTGHAHVSGEESCDSEVQILTLTNDDDTFFVSSRTNLRGVALESPEVIHGYKHVLAWKVCPKFDGQGDAHSFKGYVDARTKRVLEFKNTVHLFEAEGAVYPLSNDGMSPGGVAQADWPMSYMLVGNSLTDVGGNFDFSGTASFRGRFARINDGCGGASLSNNEPGGINWGNSGGTDCTRGRVNGQEVGGEGNTHSSRTMYYHVTHIADIASKHLPNASWLNRQLTANINRDANCNAYWNGSTINFYTSGGGCNNSGENVGIIAHEWGHDWDAYDVEGGISFPSGEGVADLYAAFYNGSSCIGRGFIPGRFCRTGKSRDLCKASSGCTGVRDIDYMQYVSESAHTMTWARNNCDENGVHCKGNVYSEAVWSLYKRELPAMGYDDLTAFELTTYLLYKAAGNVRGWYNENASAPWGGCGGFTGYRAFITADDNDGNLGNGTPHMIAIHKAFVDQEIACNDLAVRNSGCANVPDSAPKVSAASGDRRVTLTWTEVDRALSYDVMRAEGGCEKGKVKVANVKPGNGNLILTDTGLKNGFEYCYLVVPKATLNPSSCFGKVSSKIEVKPGVSQLPIPLPITPQPTPRPTPLPTRFPTPLPTRLPTPVPTPLPTFIPTNPPTPRPTRNPTASPTPIPASPPIGSSSTICNTENKEKIFKLELIYAAEIANQISWQLNSFDIDSETFVEYKTSGDSVRKTQRICIRPGTYEIVISDSGGTGMGGGNYTGFFRGGLAFASDANNVNWGEQRHIFCYGECASTTPSLSPSSALSELPSTVPSASPSTEVTPLPSLILSGVPTPSPTLRPSSKPSSSPSVVPSNEPSRRPSLNPSQIPSLDPSVEPTSSPTEVIELPLPSTLPSVNPSSESTPLPSLILSKEPTPFPSFRQSSQ